MELRTLKDEIEPNLIDKSITDFLIQEHKYFADSFWKNEERGEKILTF